MTWDGLVALWQAGFVPLALCLGIVFTWVGLTLYAWWLEKKRRG